MKKIFDQRFFRLLSECSQRKVSASEFAEAIEELATHVARMAYQVPGTVAATHQQTSPFPSISR